VALEMFSSQAGLVCRRRCHRPWLSAGTRAHVPERISARSSCGRGGAGERRLGQSACGVPASGRRTRAAGAKVRRTTWNCYSSSDRCAIAKPLGVLVVGESAISVAGASVVSADGAPAVWLGLPVAISAPSLLMSFFSSFFYSSVFGSLLSPSVGRATPHTPTHGGEMDLCVAGPSCFHTCLSLNRAGSQTLLLFLVLLLLLEPLQTHSCLLAGSLPLSNPHLHTTSPAVSLQPLAADRVRLVPGQPSGGQGGNGRHHSHDHQHNQP
jgi:hypothetical protein